MKKHRRELSPAEWEIMQVIWQADQPVTVRFVVETAYPNSEKAYTTVQTFMNILVDKDFLTRYKKNRLNYYRPLIARENVLRNSLSGVAKRMFHGSLGTMASFLVDSAELTPEELEQLKKILDEKSGEEE